MTKSDISNLPPEVRASIEAAKKAAEAKEAASSGERVNANLPPQAQAAMREMAEKMAQATTKQTAQKKTYVVKPGDSLSKIAKELLGDAARWTEIFEANKDQIEDPNLIRVGQELRIP